MDLGDLRKYINYVVNKEQTGEPLSPDNYNILLSVGSYAYYLSEYKEVLGVITSGARDLSAKVFENTPLQKFVKTGGLSPSSPPAQGLVDKPEDYFRMLDVSFTFGNGYRMGNFLTIEDFNKVRFDILSRSVKRTPIVTVVGNKIKVVPNNFASFNYTYLRMAATPNFDYCIGVEDDEEYYMPVGSQIKSDSGHYSLYDSSGTKIVDNVVHITDPAYPYVSKSVELDYDQEYLTNVGDVIISLATARSRELNLSQMVATKQ